MRGDLHQYSVPNSALVKLHVYFIALSPDREIFFTRNIRTETQLKE